MSRDWTPRELYAVEQDNIRNGRGSLWDFMKGATWHINGENFPLYSEETLVRRQENPLLGRLYESYDDLYAFLSQVTGGMALLARYETELGTYICTGQGDKESAVIRWFDGRLDEHFYYREHNDALLMDYIQNEAGKLVCNQCIIDQNEMASSAQPKAKSALADQILFAQERQGRGEDSDFTKKQDLSR